MNPRELSQKLENECSLSPFTRKWVNEQSGRVSCVFEHFDIEVGARRINLTLDVYCEKVEERYMALSIRFGRGLNKKAIFSALEPMLNPLGFGLGRLSPRSDYRLMLMGLTLSPDELVRKVNATLAELDRKKDDIQRVVEKVVG